MKIALKKRYILPGLLLALTGLVVSFIGMSRVFADTASSGSVDIGSAMAVAGVILIIGGIIILGIIFLSLY